MSTIQPGGRPSNILCAATPAPGEWLPGPFARHPSLRVLRRERWWRPVVYVGADRDGTALVVGKTGDVLGRVVRHGRALAELHAREPVVWGYVPVPDVGPDGYAVDVDVLEEGLIRVCRPLLLAERRQGLTQGHRLAMAAAGFHV